MANPQADPDGPPPATSDPSLRGGARIAAVVFALVLVAVASLGVLVAISASSEAGDPCGGRTLNALQLTVAGTGFAAALLALVGVLGYPDRGARWLKRGSRLPSASGLAS